MRELAIGSTVAGYRIEDLIGRGGMGVVYRATHLTLERPVALKLIARELVGDEKFRQRFLRESRLAASLDHPAIVPIFDSREVDGELIVAMRLVEGGDLHRLLQRGGPLAPERAVALLGQVAEALDAAHAAGIVHRDVKPQNILVEGDRAFLSDFGLAKALGESGPASTASVVGTVEYMSPEQWRGSRVGPPADVYSLGCVLYEALTGGAPFARQEGDAEPQLPPGLAAAIERAVAKDPADRYPSAGALIAAAREAQGDSPAPTRALGERDRPTAPMASTPASPVRRLGGRGRLLLVAGVGAVALAVALAVVLLGGGGVSVSAPIPVAQAPLRVAANDEAVWVTSSADGTLSRIDPESAEVTAGPFPLDPGVSGVTTGGGAVWVSSPERGEVLRVSPESGGVLQRIEVGGRPDAIVFGGRRVWVADAGGSGVTAINAAGGRVLKRGIPPHAAPLRLAVGAGGIWASSASTGIVRRIDLGGAAAGPPIAVGRGPAGITVGGGIVWVADSRADRVTRVDPSTHALLGEPIEVGGRPGGIDAGTTVVWVANALDDTVSRLDIETGEPVGSPVGVGRDPGAVAIGGGAVWVADNGEDAVTRIEP